MNTYYLKQTEPHLGPAYGLPKVNVKITGKLNICINLLRTFETGFATITD